MKKLTLALIIAAMMTVPVCADLPDTYTSSNPDELNEIDVDSLTEDELKTAYNALRETYSACYQVMLDEHKDSLTGNKDNEAEEPVVESDLWKVKYYVDQFQQPTEEAYIAPSEVLEGTFSNSVTTNSLLYASILIDNDSIGFKLYEYGDNPVKGYYSDGHFYDIWTLIDGEKTWMKGKLYKGSSTVYLTDRFIEQFVDFLKSGSEMKIYMSESDGNSTYLFTIPASEGFADLYAQTFGG